MYGIRAIHATDKLLIHLLECYGSPREFEFMYSRSPELPVAGTQDGIANTIGVTRPRISKILKRLVAEGYIKERIARVQAGARRVRIYFLTEKGIIKAQKIKDDVGQLEVTVRSSDGKQKALSLTNLMTTLAQEYRIKPKLIDVLRFIEHTDAEVIDYRALQKFMHMRYAGKISEPRDPQTEIDMSSERVRVYEVALRRAMADRKITDDEARILEDLRIALNITDEEQERIKNKIMDRERQDLKERKQLYEIALKRVWKDLKVIPDELRILEDLRAELNLSLQTHRELELKVLKSYGKSYKNKLKILGTVLNVYMANNIISPEDYIYVEQIKRELGIRDKDYSTLLGKYEIILR